MYRRNDAQFLGKVTSPFAVNVHGDRRKCDGDAETTHNTKEVDGTSSDIPIGDKEEEGKGVSGFEKPGLRVIGGIRRAGNRRYVHHKTEGVSRHAREAIRYVRDGAHDAKSNPNVHDRNELYLDLVRLAISASETLD